MKTKEARELGRRIANLIAQNQIEPAYALLAPILAERTPFAMLRHIGDAVGVGPLKSANDFLDFIAADKTEGGWVIIASALEQQLGRDLTGAFNRCREFIIVADVWYGADTLGEGVPGRALVANFKPALALLKPWREDDNAWVRRIVGVSVHYWAKRSRGAAELTPQAKELLALLEPMFGEWDMDAVKGVGWGLKTMGRKYPGLVTDWLAEQVVPNQRRHRAVMLRKALTYLSGEQRARITGKGPAGF
ncbi:MAG: DNA alkylation repair protein [Anaerolineae bacterium]|nr:DNA alkylation repair protein [Anaerolineae bacterium]